MNLSLLADLPRTLFELMMYISSSIVVLALVLFTSSAIANPAPHFRHESHGLHMKSPDPVPELLIPSRDDILPIAIQPRQIKIEGLPDTWSGLFRNFQSCRPSIPVAATFIRFFRSAGRTAIDAGDVRQSMRFSYGSLVLEIISEGLLTKEFVQATSLFLLNQAQRGWIGFFEAWVKDVTNGEVNYMRFATIFDLPEDGSNSPWD